MTPNEFVFDFSVLKDFVPLDHLIDALPEKEGQRLRQLDRLTMEDAEHGTDRCTPCMMRELRSLERKARRRLTNPKNHTRRKQPPLPKQDKIERARGLTQARTGCAACTGGTPSIGAVAVVAATDGSGADGDPEPDQPRPQCREGAGDPARRGQIDLTGSSPLLMELAYLMGLTARPPGPREMQGGGADEERPPAAAGVSKEAP